MESFLCFKNCSKVFVVVLFGSFYMILGNTFKIDEVLNREYLDVGNLFGEGVEIILCI